MDETEHWKPAGGGPALAGVLDRNLAKSNSRAVETCNAWEPGEETVAEETYDAWIAQEENRTTSESLILYDARIAPPDTVFDDELSLERGIAEAYGDCFWVDQRTIKGKALSLRTDPDMAKRFYLNWAISSKSKWTTPQLWSRLSDPTVVVADKDEIVAFFDGSRTRDATALIGCHVATGHVFTIGVWEPAFLREGSTEKIPVPVPEVDAAVENMFDRWTVRDSSRTLGNGSRSSGLSGRSDTRASLRLCRCRAGKSRWQLPGTCGRMCRNSPCRRSLPSRRSTTARSLRTGTPGPPGTLSRPSAPRIAGACPFPRNPRIQRRRSTLPCALSALEWSEGCISPGTRRRRSRRPARFTASTDEVNGRSDGIAFAG